MADTPVVLIIFRRPEPTRRVVDALRRAKVSRLFVIADGPRSHVPGDREQVHEARRILTNLDWPCDVTTIYSDVNLGLRQRVLSGLDEVFSQVDRAIILEDDCLPHQDFFQFASELLDRYRETPEVGIISGNNFAPSAQLSESYYFSTHANIWGWATWRRTWTDFRNSANPLPVLGVNRRRLRERLPGAFRSKSFLKLTDEAARLDSWAIQFAVWLHLSEKLCAVPKVNLVKNIGFGKESTHTKFESYADEIEIEPIGFPLTHPSRIHPNYREMKKESQLKALRWITFPLAHPVDFVGRILRAAKLFSAKSRS